MILCLSLIVFYTNEDGLRREKEKPKTTKDGHANGVTNGVPNGVVQSATKFVR
jgi:hypothetical protein